MLVDANLLLYAVDSRSPLHERARVWLTNALNGHVRVGLPWQCLTAFVQISTHPRVSEHPLTPRACLAACPGLAQVRRGLDTSPTEHHADVLGGLVTGHDLRGNLVSDAARAALAIELGLRTYSADSDFARFPEVTWVNPVLIRPDERQR